ncbi:MAG TPA: MMPL family transporter [bacterium]|nr:MMPL family transporter [bacterium]
MKTWLFRMLGRGVTGGWLAVIALWVVAAAWLVSEAPRLADVASSTESNFLPPESDSVKAKELLDRYFPKDSFASRAVIAIEKETPLSEQDLRYVADVTGWLEKGSGISAIKQVFSAANMPYLRERLVSKDGKAALIIVNLQTVFIAKESQEAVEAISDRLKRHPPGIVAAVTGDAGLGRDYQQAIRESLDSTTKVTLSLLIVILLVIFRSPVTPVIPLATIGASFAITRAIVALIAKSGVAISPLTEIFLIVVLFGVGTDYCIFLISRYREELENGLSDTEAMEKAIEKVGESISSSAFTVIVGLGFMCFAKFGPFAKTGPCVAMGVGISLLASLTLAPALMLLLSRSLFWPFRIAQGTSVHAAWRRLAGAVVNYPLMAILALSFCFAPFIWYGFSMNRSFDLFTELNDDAPAVRGLEIIKSHFLPGELAPLTVVVETDDDLWKPSSIDKIYQLSKVMEGMPCVAQALSAVQPTGNISWLEKGLLPYRFSQYAEGIRKGRDGLQQIQAGLQKSIDGVKLFKNNIQKHTQPSQMLFIKTAPDKRYLEAFKRIDELQSALNRMSDGVGKVHEGLGHVTESMQALFAPHGEFSYLFDHVVLPDTIFLERPELKNVMSYYLSEDGKAMRLTLILKTKTFSDEEKEAIDEVRKTLNGEMARLKFRMPRLHMAGASATIYDERIVTRDDFFRIVFFVLSGVFVILLILLGDLAESIYLIVTMLVSYIVTLGVTTLVFQFYLCKAGIDWKVQFFMFVILIALGVDYNILLMSRIKEERRRLETREAVRVAVTRTGEIISYCGLIMAGTFLSLMTSPLSAMMELGFTLVFGILLDTFIVRPMLVPAIIVLLDRARMHYFEEGSVFRLTKSDRQAD